MSVVILTNRGAHADTWEAWAFYERVRSQFVDWNHVVLTFVDDDPAGSKLVTFVDDQDNVLDVHSVNYGYEGGTPSELVTTLLKEGFRGKERVEDLIFNPRGDQTYPKTIARD